MTIVFCSCIILITLIISKDISLDSVSLELDYCVTVLCFDGVDYTLVHFGLSCSYFSLYSALLSLGD